MNFENLKKLKNEQFYRYFGIKRFHFDEMLTMDGFHFIGH
ncbi:hypothetical protein SAP269_10790 [Spiroplasma ixodetis]|uniref:Uncharacterized protein n=1 Tax=Spiroplasma ixodetis TaxID=2141 RepID=A0ABN7BW71_9MOLU